MGAHPEVIAAIQWASTAGQAEMLDLANQLASVDSPAARRAVALLRRIANEPQPSGRATAAPPNPALSGQAEVEAVAWQMQFIATDLDKRLKSITGQRQAFALLVATHTEVQYVSNASREDGALMAQQLISRWKEGSHDVPPQYRNMGRQR